MSVEFTLSGCSLDEAGWNEVLANWAAEREPFEDPRFANGEAFLLAEGSRRGALLTRRERDVDVRLSALASRADWRNAYAVVREALARGGGTFTREDGQVLSADDLTPEAADEAAVRDFVFAAQAADAQLQQGAATLELPLGQFSLTVRPGDIPSPCRPEDVPAVEERLSARVARYATAFHAATLVVAADGKRVRLSTWARVPTLIASNVHVVSVQGLERGADVVPLPVLREILGDRIEQAGQRLYLPQLDDATHGEELGKLRGAGTSLERFVADRRDELDDDTGPAPAEDGQDVPAQLDAEVRRAARSVAQSLLDDRDPAEARDELLRAGANRDAVNATFAAAGVILKIMQEEGGLTERAQQRIQQEGVPAFVRDIVLQELDRAIRQHRRAPYVGCGCLLLILAAIVGLVVKLLR